MVFASAAGMDKKPAYGRCFWRLIVACLMATPVTSGDRFMKSDVFVRSYYRLAVALLIFGSHYLLAAPEPGAAIATNASTTTVTLDALVADVLAHNPELNFYTAEIAAAKGERRTAATWANPEVTATVGEKRVTAGSLASEGIAWSVSARQTFEWPGRIPLRKAIANHQIKLVEL